MEKLEIGDIVTFKDCPDWRFVVHRILEDGTVDLYGNRLLYRGVSSSKLVPLLCGKTISIHVSQLKS